MTQRKTAPDTHYCVRRVPAWSTHWVSPDVIFEAAFHDKKGEVSVNLFSDPPDEKYLLGRFDGLRKSHGVGFALAHIPNIHEQLAKKKMTAAVYEDFNKNNPDHGVIVPIVCDNGRECLKLAFKQIVAPTPIQKIALN